MPLDKTAVLVAVPSKDLPGEEEKHATLIFFGDIESRDSRVILNTLRGIDFSDVTFPFTDEVVSRKLLGEDNAVVWILDGKKLSSIRSKALSNKVVKAMFNKIKQFPNFTPHVTSGYEISIKDKNFQDVDEITFDSLEFWHGKKRYPIIGKVSKANVTWDGDGVQGAGQPRDRSGRWIGLPGPTDIGQIGIFENANGEYEVRSYDAQKKGSEDSGSPQKILRKYKRKGDANNFLAQKIKEDAAAYQKNKRSVAAVKEKHKQSRDAIAQSREKIAEGDARVISAMASSIQSLSALSGETPPPKDSKAVEAGLVERLPNPGVPTGDNYKAANKWAKENYPTEEANYAGLVARLLKNKKITQDPTVRGEVADRYGITPKRQVQIEQEMYEHLVPESKAKVPAKRKSNIVGSNPYISPRQREEIESNGGRKVVPVAGNRVRPSRMYKANKGENRGKFVVTDYQGNTKQISDAEAEKIVVDSNEAAQKQKEFQDVKRAAYKKAQKELLELSDADAEAIKEFKIARAKEWAESVGLDPEDSYWWGVFNNDKTLIRAQGGLASPTSRLIDKPKDSTSRDRRKRSAPVNTSAGTDGGNPQKESSRRSEKTTGSETNASEPESAASGNTSRALRTPKPSKSTPEKSVASSSDSKSPEGKAKKKVAAEPQVFEDQKGLGLTPDGTKQTDDDKPYQVPSYPPTIDPGVRKATEKDIAQLAELGIKIPEKHKNIRVPKKKMKGFGSYNYMYDDHFITSDKVVEGRKTYTVDHQVAASRRKFDRIGRIADNIHKLDDVLKKNYAKDDSHGAVTLMRVLGMRPSNESGGGSVVPVRNDKGEIVDRVSVPTFGTISMKREHVTVNGDEVTISLTGKSAHEIKIKTNDPHVVGAIKAALERNSEGDPSDRLFPTATPSQTDKIIKSVIPDIKKKDLRTYVATELARQKIASMEPPENLAEFRRGVKEVTETTANQLQHGPTMSKKSYVDPGVFMEWAHTAGVDYELYEGTLNRLIKPIGWEELERVRAERKAAKLNKK